MESKTEIKPYNIISIKIDNLILNNSLSIDINKDIKIKFNKNVELFKELKQVFKNL